MKFIDESKFLIKFLERLSNFLAKQRGFPIIVGVLLIVAAGILEFVNLAIASQFIEVFRIIFHHVGLVVAFVGILLLEPLGQ